MPKKYSIYEGAIPLRPDTLRSLTAQVKVIAEKATNEKWTQGLRVAVVDYYPSGDRPRLIAYGEFRIIKGQVVIIADDGRVFDPDKVYTLPPRCWPLTDSSE